MKVYQLDSTFFQNVASEVKPFDGQLSTVFEHGEYLITQVAAAHCFSHGLNKKDLPNVMRGMAANFFLAVYDLEKPTEDNAGGLVPNELYRPHYDEGVERIRWKREY